MKAKSLGTLIASVLGVGALVLTGALIIGNGDLSTLGIARATPTSVGQYTLTADDFGNGGNIQVSKGGATWQCDNVIVSGSTVTIKSVMYTTVRSGASKNDERRGNGYTRIVFEGFDKTDSPNVVVHETNVDGGNEHTDIALTSDLDLTLNGTVSGSERRGLYIAQANDKSFSFTSMTLYYECSDVSPEVIIQNASLSVGVGETGNLTAKNNDVFDGDNPSYAWSSDKTNIATVVGNGLSATVTGVAAGSATITVTMTVGGHNYTDTLDIKVTATQATVYEMSVLDTSRIQGAGIFCNFNPSSVTGLTAATLNGLASTKEVTLEFEDSGVTTQISNIVLQDTFDDSFTAYVVCDKADGLNGAFTVTVTFKDNANNIHYKSIFHFDNGALAPDIVLTAAQFSVNEGEDLQITASKASFIEGAATFAFASLDETIFTVSANGAVATVHGVKEGSEKLRVTMTVGGKNYVRNQTIAVTKAGVKHLIPWYTDGASDSNTRNHWEGAGIWTWVNYGELGYTWATFSALDLKNITVSYASSTSTTVTVNTISNDLGTTLKSARVYIVAGAAYNTGVLTMKIPDANGITYTGTITFVDGEATAYNSGL